MKNKIKSIIFFVLTILFSASCEKDEDPVTLVGGWEYVESNEFRTYVMTINVRDDNTGTIAHMTTYSNGKKETELNNFTWITNGDTLIATEGDDTMSWKYSIAGDSLLLTSLEDGSSRIYKRI